FDLHRLVIGQTDVAGSLTRQSGGGWAARLRGSRFDARHWFTGGTGGDDDSAIEPSFPLTLDIDLGRVLLDEGASLRTLALKGSYDGMRWRQASLGGQIGNGAVGLQLQPGSPMRRLEINAADAGALLKALGLTSQVQGGRLRLTATLDNARPRLAG